jgi:predicted permease
MLPLRYAARTLRRSPLYTTLSLATLALGLGLAASVFLYALPLLLRNLPVEHAASLVTLSASGDGDRFSYPLYQDLRDRTPVFASLAARCAAPVDLRLDNRTLPVHAEVVSGNWFEALGLGVALGRGLTPADNRVPGGHSVAVLTYDFWQTAFDGSPAVLHKVVLLNGHPMTIVGVAARGYRGFDLGERTDLLVPTMMQAAMIPRWYGIDDRGRPWVQLVGRLRPGVTLSEAEARLDPFYRALSGIEPGGPGLVAEGPALRLTPAPQGASDLRARLAPPLRTMAGWTAILLLFVFANQAALAAGRAGRRQRETAIRIALGAPRRRVVAPLAAEAVLLAVGAAGLGLLLAGWIAGGTFDLVAAGRDTGLSAAIGPWTVLFTLALALLLAGLPAAAAALRAAAVPLPSLLGQRPDNSAPPAGQAAWIKAAAAAELAIALAMAGHAAILVRTLRTDLRPGPGVPVRGLFSFSVDPVLAGYPADRARHFVSTLRDRIAALPGVESATIASAPITAEAETDPVRIAGYPPSTPQVRRAGPAYFATLGIPLQGRPLGADCRDAVANRAWMEGRTFDAREAGALRLIGVAQDRRPQPTVYLPLCGQPAGALTLYVRAAGDPSLLFPGVYRTAAEMDSAIPVTNLRTMRDEFAAALAPQRVAAAAGATAAGIAIGIAVIGIFALATAVAARRRQEFGIRLALGASRHTLRVAIAREVALVAAAGLVVGAGLAAILRPPV